MIATNFMHSIFQKEKQTLHGAQKTRKYSNDIIQESSKIFRVLSMKSLKQSCHQLKEQTFSFHFGSNSIQKAKEGLIKPQF